MSEGNANSDRILVERVRAGNQSAFGPLIAPHSARLLTLAARMLSSSAEAEEAVQDALASVWIARRRLDPVRAVGPYLTTVTLNKCRDRLRRRKLASLIGITPILDGWDLPDMMPDPETAAISRDALARLRLGIERLPIRLREALVLVAIDGRSLLEAAELLEISEKAVETRVYRARKQLREKFAYFEG